MAYTFHNSKADGTPDQQIASGDINALFDTLTTQDRINGTQDFSKVWITSDTDLTVYIGLNSPSPYSSNVFLSASDNDTEADLTGNETRYGALEVVSATASDVTVNNNPDYTLVRDGDHIIISGGAYTVGTVTDNGDGTSTVTTTTTITSVPAAGDFVTSVFSLNLVTATAKSFWREEKVAAGSPWVSEYATAQILIGD